MLVCSATVQFFFSRGWEQLEVTCNPIVHHSHNLWNVEGHENERGEKEWLASRQLYIWQCPPKASVGGIFSVYSFLKCWPI